MFWNHILLIIKEINAICSIASDESIVFSTSRNNLRPLRRSDKIEPPERLFDLPTSLLGDKSCGRFGLLHNFNFPGIICFYVFFESDRIGGPTCSQSPPLFFLILGLYQPINRPLKFPLDYLKCWRQ